jgi:hypothetical protein
MFWTILYILLISVCGAYYHFGGQHTVPKYRAPMPRGRATRVAQTPVAYDERASKMSLKIPSAEAAVANNDENPELFMDNIFTLEVMKEPVVATDGFTYEKRAILEWFRTKRTSPTTGAVLASTNLIPNNTLKSHINQWMEKRAKAKVVPTAAAPTPSVPHQKTEVCTCSALLLNRSEESRSFSRCTLNSEYCLTRDDYIVNVATHLSLTENYFMLERVCEELSKKVIATRHANPYIPSMVYRANLRLEIQMKVFRKYVQSL